MKNADNLLLFKQFTTTVLMFVSVIFFAGALLLGKKDYHKDYTKRTYDMTSYIFGTFLNHMPWRIIRIIFVLIGIMLLIITIYIWFYLPEDFLITHTPGPK